MWVTSYAQTNANLGHLRFMRSLLNWSRPEKDWIKFNTDGAMSNNDFHAFIGGVFNSNA